MIPDAKLRSNTLAAISDSSVCVEHRVGVTESVKNRIIQTLEQQHLLNANRSRHFPGGLRNGVFPWVPDDGSACPHLPQPFRSAPGGPFEGGHHSYPGGLAIHEAFNEASSLSLAADYRLIYGSLNGQSLPAINSSMNAAFDQMATAIELDQDIIIAAPIWHDWAKTIVFQWKTDGTEFSELEFAGNGKRGNYGHPGDSETGAHHILGIAEAMKRGLSAEVVIAIASAHSAPTPPLVDECNEQ